MHRSVRTSDSDRTAAFSWTRARPICGCGQRRRGLCRLQRRNYRRLCGSAWRRPGAPRCRCSGRDGDGWSRTRGIPIRSASWLRDGPGIAHHRARGGLRLRGAAAAADDDKTNPRLQARAYAYGRLVSSDRKRYLIRAATELNPSEGFALVYAVMERLLDRLLEAEDLRAEPEVDALRFAPEAFGDVRHRLRKTACLEGDRAPAGGALSARRDSAGALVRGAGGGALDDGGVARGDGDSEGAGVAEAPAGYAGAAFAGGTAGHAGAGCGTSSHGPRPVVEFPGDSEGADLAALWDEDLIGRAGRPGLIACIADGELGRSETAVWVGFCLQTETALCALQHAHSRQLQLVGQVEASWRELVQLRRRWSREHIVRDWYRPSERLLGYFDGGVD